MRAKILLFLAGLAVGVAGTWLLKPSEPPLPVAEQPATIKPEKVVEQAKGRIELLEGENARLASQLAELQEAARTTPTNAPLPKRESPFGKMFGDGSDTNRSGAMGNMIKAAMQQQIDMKVSAMKLRLKLTEEQEQSIRELLNKQFGAAGDVAAKMFQGKTSKADIEKQNASAGDTKTQIKDLLTPEQQAEYEKYQIEERQTKAQMLANVEVLQLQSMLQLTQAQQDQVFQILYQQAEQNLTQTDGGTRIPMDWEKQLDAKKQALAGVLTPEQLQSYEKFLASQREMMKAFMPKDALAGAVSISVESSP